MSITPLVSAAGPSLFMAVVLVRGLTPSVHAVDLEVRTDIASHGASGTRMGMQFIACAMEAACHSMQVRAIEQQSATGCSILAPPDYISSKFKKKYRAVQVETPSQNSTKIFSFGSTQCQHGLPVIGSTVNQSLAIANGSEINCLTRTFSLPSFLAQCLKDQRGAPHINYTACIPPSLWKAGLGGSVWLAMRDPRMVWQSYKFKWLVKGLQNKTNTHCRDLRFMMHTVLSLFRYTLYTRLAQSL